MTASREFLVAGIVAVVILSGALVGVQVLRNMRGCTIEPVRVKPRSDGGVSTQGSVSGGGTSPYAGESRGTFIIQYHGGGGAVVSGEGGPAGNHIDPPTSGDGGPATGGGFDPSGGNGGPAR